MANDLNTILAAVVVHVLGSLIASTLITVAVLVGLNKVIK